MPAEPIWDRAARLRALGLQPSTLAPACLVDHESLWDWQECQHCHDVHEPQLVTGNGPQGLPWGRGRGELTERDKLRLRFYVEHVRGGPP